MTYDDLLALAAGAQGRTLHTVMGKAFTVGVYLDSPVFTPASTGQGRSDGRLAAERFLERYNNTRSSVVKDYADVTRNASYLLALVQSAQVL